MARPETLTRYELVARKLEEPDVTMRMNVLLDNDNLKPGNMIILEDDPQQIRWTVDVKHATLLRKSIKQTWYNNI